MSLKHKLISFSYYPLFAFERLERFFNTENNKLRVLLFHDIPKNMFPRYEDILRWLSKEWDFISPAEFSEIIDSKKVNGKKILLTFDDGFISDYYFSKEILKPMGIEALHFIITDYLNTCNNESSYNFLENNLYPEWKGESIPSHKNELLNMRPEHLKFLIDSGHEIGFHTKSHKRLSSIDSKNNLILEIIDGANDLESIIDKKVKHFAYSFGDLESFSKDAMNIAQTRFKYIYTGMRGNNATVFDRLSIRRDTINSNFSKNLIGSFLYGAADFIYKNKFKSYSKWYTN
tara:strand:+ start:900 stop:1766 length:867 start_codon:yes stop_codon:yes gene_type:complete